MSNLQWLAIDLSINRLDIKAFDSMDDRMVTENYESGYSDWLLLENMYVIDTNYYETYFTVPTNVGPTDMHVIYGGCMAVCNRPAPTDVMVTVSTNSSTLIIDGCDGFDITLPYVTRNYGAKIIPVLTCEWTDGDGDDVLSSVLLVKTFWTVDDDGEYVAKYLTSVLHDSDVWDASSPLPCYLDYYTYDGVDTLWLGYNDVLYYPCYNALTITVTTPVIFATRDGDARVPCVTVSSNCTSTYSDDVVSLEIICLDDTCDISRGGVIEAVVDGDAACFTDLKYVSYNAVVVMSVRAIEKPTVISALNVTVLVSSEAVYMNTEIINKENVYVIGITEIKLFVNIRAKNLFNLYDKPFTVSVTSLIPIVNTTEFHVAYLDAGIVGSGTCVRASTNSRTSDLVITSKVAAISKPIVKTPKAAVAFSVSEGTTGVYTVKVTSDSVISFAKYAKSEGNDVIECMNGTDVICIKIVNPISSIAFLSQPSENMVIDGKEVFFDIDYFMIGCEV